MKRKGIKYYYFFRGSLDKHIEFYKGWVDIARKKDLLMEMVTTLYFLNYLNQQKLIKHYRSIPYIHIVVCPPFIASVFTFFFFFHKLLRHEKVIVHIRKRSPRPFELLKRIFKDRLRYLIELEGDIFAEREYLLAHPYKKGFYDDVTSRTKKKEPHFRDQLERADHIITVTQRLRDIQEDRYPGIGVLQKTTVMPTGVNTDLIRYSPDDRTRMRQELGIDDRFVLVYTGNAHYSWQNVHRTIEVFQLIKRELKPNAFLMLLVRAPDHEIVKEFIAELGLADGDHLLTEVPHTEMNGYLNAADLSILLRHYHPMNEAASPGKFGEYLGAGLPIITTGVVCNAHEVVEKGYGIILEDVDDNNEIIEKVRPYLEIDERRREEISGWAQERFSTDSYAEIYVNTMMSLAGNETTDLVQEPTDQ